MDRCEANPMMRALVAALLLTCALAAPASAHQSSITYIEATLHDERLVDVSVRLALRDLTEDMGGIDEFPDEIDELIATHKDMIVAHVTAHLEVQDGETPCPPSAVTVARSDDRIEVRFTATCPAPPIKLVIDDALVFGVDKNHSAALRVHVPGEKPADALLAIDNNRF